MVELVRLVVSQEHVRSKRIKIFKIFRTIENRGNIVSFGHVRFSALLGKQNNLQQRGIYVYVLDR